MIWLNSICHQSKAITSQLKYYILLLITDGKIDDFQQTVDEVVRGTSLPLSILIVGVGDDKFKEMDDLDADEKPLYSNKYKKFMERDIVQFVPFLRYKNNPNELAKQTLEEIPDQLTSFMKSKNIVPSQFGSQLNGNMVKGLDYYETRKSQFMAKCSQMGYSNEKLEAIMAKGIPEDSFDLLVTHIENPSSYNNPLK
jgi:hypothetical protein